MQKHHIGRFFENCMQSGHRIGPHGCHPAIEDAVVYWTGIDHPALATKVRGNYRRFNGSPRDHCKLSRKLHGFSVEIFCCSS